MVCCGNMPLLSEFTDYADWEIDAKRWARMLYSRPVSTGEDYFVNNSEGSKTSNIDTNAGGFRKRKVKAKVGENEKAILKGENYGPVGYEWAFKVLGGKSRDPGGVSIVRIAGQFSGIGKFIYRELGPWGN